MTKLQNKEHARMCRRRSMLMRSALLLQQIQVIRSLTVILAADEAAQPRVNDQHLAGLANIEEALRKAQTAINSHVLQVVFHGMRV
jgi:hypothetical protein